MNISSHHHLMFDIDGTLLKSCEFDGELYDQAVQEVTGLSLHPDRRHYTHVSDEGILRQHFTEAGIHDIANQIMCVKTLFIEKITHYLAHTPAQEIPGANRALQILRNEVGPSLSFATGGWEETARLKLLSAGIDTGTLPFASSNDHYDRCKIMQIAKQRAEVSEDQNISYIGDGEWDKNACKTLNWNFILVGNGTDHNQKIKNFLDLEKLQHFTSHRGY